MPLYPYVCRNCGKRFSIRMSYSEYEEKAVHCPHCGSSEVTRHVGRVRFARSEESRMDAWSDPAALAGMQDDPRAMAKMMRDMGNEMGEDTGGEFDEVVERLEAGENPEDIEKDMPDMAGDIGGDDDF